MKTNCYYVEMNSAIDGLFEQLDDYGFDYFWDDFSPIPGFIEIYVDYYPQEIRVLEQIFAPYV